MFNTVTKRVTVAPIYPCLRRKVKPKPSSAIKQMTRLST